MKSLFVAFVLLCLALNVKCGYDLYFEYTCADEYFKPQDGQLHLIANFKDSTVDDFFKRGFNFTYVSSGYYPLMKFFLNDWKSCFPSVAGFLSY